MTTPLPPPTVLERLVQFVTAPYPSQNVLFYASRFPDILLRLDLVARPYTQDTGVRLTTSAPMAIAEALAERPYDDGFGIVVVFDRDRLSAAFDLTREERGGGDGNLYTDNLDMPLLPYARSIVAITPTRAIRIREHAPQAFTDHLDLTGTSPAGNAASFETAASGLILALALRLAGAARPQQPITLG